MIIGPLTRDGPDLVNNQGARIVCIKNLRYYFDFPFNAKNYWLQITKNPLHESVAFVNYIDVIEVDQIYATFYALEEFLRKLKTGQTYYGRVLWI